MSNLTTYQRQDLFETELAAAITAAATAITIVTAPSFTLSSGSYYATIDPTGTPEIVEITAQSGTSLTVTRGIALYEGAGSSAAVHAGGVKFLISNNWKVFDKIREAIATKFDAAGGTFTGSVLFSGSTTYFRVPNLTTAQRTALVAANGMHVYDTDLGASFEYIGGAWTNMGSTTVVNASDHAAGKVDIASASEIAAATAADATSGATNVLSVASTKKGSTSSSDENKVPVLDANGDVHLSAIPVGTSEIQSKTTLTTKGDVYVATASGTVTRQAIGSDAQLLMSDAAQTNGLKWKTLPTPFVGVDTFPSVAVTTTSDLTFTTNFTAGIIIFELGNSTFDGDTNDFNHCSKFVYAGTTLKYWRGNYIQNAAGSQILHSAQFTQATQPAFASTNTNRWNVTYSVNSVTTTTVVVRRVATMTGSPSAAPSEVVGLMAWPTYTV